MKQDQDSGVTYVGGGSAGPGVIAGLRPHLLARRARLALARDVLALLLLGAVAALGVGVATDRAEAAAEGAAAIVLAAGVAATQSRVRHLERRIAVLDDEAA